MSNITVRPIKRSEITAVQEVFNHKAVIEGLGGFTMEETIKTSAFNARPGLWAAFVDNKTPIGAMMAGGRPQIHLFKYGSVGVLPEYRRQRVSTALYAACTMQAIIEGRRLFEDTIVGDNDAQHAALPTMGLTRSGILKHRTGSGKSIHLYQLSAIDDENFLTRFRIRISESEHDFQFLLDENAITRDWWQKNKEAASKHTATSDCWQLGITKAAHDVIGMHGVTVIIDREVEAAPQRGQKKIHNPNTPALFGEDPKDE